MSGSGRGPADLIVLGGTIHTAESGAPNAQAFAVREGRFAYVGSREGAMALRGPATQMLDASERTILPGLTDAHLHLTRLGLTLVQADLRGAESEDEMAARAAAFATSSPDEWILGDGWDQNLWPGARFPAQAALSAAIPDRPAALSRVDGHALVANAKAIAAAGVDSGTPDPPGGRILRDERGNPTGLFIDTAQSLVLDRVPPPSHERLVNATKAAIAHCNRWGVTAVAEPGATDAFLAAHAEAIEMGAYSIRNHVMLYDDVPLDEHFARGPIEGAHDGRLWIRAVKMFADGALGSRGAALLEPYADDPANDGLLVTSPERMEDVTARAIRAGFQPCIHAIGDRANRIALDLYERALSAGASAAEIRPRIEHAQIVHPDDAARLGRLGIIASVQAVHQVSDMGWVPARLGAARLPRAYPWRWLLDGGALVANGTDAPVERVDTPRSFHAAIARDGWYTEHRMSRSEAFAAMTIGAAHANFQERAAGSIRAGAYADFAILDRDWMSVPEDSISGTRILATYFAGRAVYEDDR